MTALMGVLSLLASEASLVSQAWIWNAMVPRLEMVKTLRKLDVNATLVTVVSALAVLLKQLNLQALRASDDGATSIALVATMASMASMVASMASMVASMASMVASMASMASMASRASTEMVASMESKETLMASMVSEAPMAMLDLASLAFMAVRVWVTDLNRRKLRYEMLKLSPWKTWICSSKKQAWDVEGSRSSRRVDVANVKMELMDSQVWSVGLTWAMMASMASVVASMASVVASMASMASMASTEMRVASVALGASRIWVIVLNRRILSNEWLRLSPLESWLGPSSKQTWVMTDPEARDGLTYVKMEMELRGSLIWSDVMMWARMASMASMGASMASMVSMAPGARMEIASAAMKDLKAVAPVLIWSKLENKLLVLQQPSYDNSSKICWVLCC